MPDLTSEIILGYKTARARSEFASAPERLRDIAFAFAVKSLALGVRAILTRVREDAAGQATRVHAAGRAVDFRSHYILASGEIARLYSDEQVEELLTHVRTLFPRSDGKARIIHHAVPGSVPHFHLQIAWSELTPDERKVFQ